MPIPMGLLLLVILIQLVVVVSPLLFPTEATTTEQISAARTDLDLCVGVVVEETEEEVPRSSKASRSSDIRRALSLFVEITFQNVPLGLLPVFLYTYKSLDPGPVKIIFPFLII